MIRHPWMVAALMGAVLLGAGGARAQDAEVSQTRRGISVGTPTYSPRGTLTGGTTVAVRVRVGVRGGRVTAVSSWVQVGNSRTRVVSLRPSGGGIWATTTSRIQLPANNSRRALSGYLYVRGVSTAGSATKRVAIRIGPGSGDTNRPPDPPNI